jgi:hypothetical protein
LFVVSIPLWVLVPLALGFVFMIPCALTTFGIAPIFDRGSCLYFFRAHERTKAQLVEDVLVECGGLRRFMTHNTKHVWRSMLDGVRLIVDQLSPEAAEQLRGVSRGYAIPSPNPAQCAQHVVDQITKVRGEWDPIIIHDPDPELKPGCMSLVVVPFLDIAFVCRWPAIRMKNAHR